MTDLFRAKLFPKTAIPCLHVWEFINNEDEYGFESYMKCEHCHKIVPYEPPILGVDIEVTPIDED